MPAELETVRLLRADLALQIARVFRRSGLSQVAMAAKLGIPQPTLSKIANGQVGELSLELLIRIAVRAKLPLVLQTGAGPEESGVYVNAPPAAQQRAQRSKLADSARRALAGDARRLAPTERLAAHLRHCELVAALRKAALPAGARKERGRRVPTP